MNREYREGETSISNSDGLNVKFGDAVSEETRHKQLLDMLEIQKKAEQKAILNNPSFIEKLGGFFGGILGRQRS